LSSSCSCSSSVSVLAFILAASPRTSNSGCSQIVASGLRRWKLGESLHMGRRHKMAV
jgi:hypothetical protein